MYSGGKQRNAEERHYWPDERKTQALAFRSARKQLLLVPWRRFRRAYNAYAEWLALSFWVRAAVEGRGHAPSEVRITLRDRCPRFLKTLPSSLDQNLLGFQLLEWVHGQFFRDAKKEGWLEALTFFGTRHIHSRAAWSLWEQGKQDQRGVPPGIFQSFENWRRCSLETVICGERTYSQTAVAIERCLRLESIVCWIDPLLIPGAKLPKLTVRNLARDLRRCCRQSPCITVGREGSAAFWLAQIGSAKRAFLSDSVPAACIGQFWDYVRHHPWNVRLNAYGKIWAGQKTHSQSRHYPSFRHWLLRAESFVRHSGP